MILDVKYLLNLLVGSMIYLRYLFIEYLVCIRMKISFLAFSMKFAEFNVCTLIVLVYIIIPG